MALREELDNYNAEIVVGPEDNPQVTNAQLAVEEWNRTTVADGAWLQQNAIGPLSARDIVLANAIDDTNEALSELSGKMTGVDGRSLKSINGRFFSGDEAWEGSKDAVVPDGSFVNKDEAVYIPKNNEAILSMNDDGGHSFQLQLKPNEIGYRYLAGSNTAAGQGDYGAYKYDTQASGFRSVLIAPAGSGNYLVNSAGGFQELKFDPYAFTENENGEVAIKNSGNWKRTTSGLVEETAGDEETYFHGGPLYLASATHSTFVVDGMSKLDGTVKNTDMIIGGVWTAPDTKIVQSRGQMYSTYLSGDACIVNSDVFFNSSKIYSGGSVSSSYFRADDGYVYDTNRYDIVNVGRSTISAVEYSIVNGVADVYNARHSIVNGGGLHVSGVKDSIIHGESFGASGIERSLILGTGGKTVSDISDSLVVGGVAAGTVNNVQRSLNVGGGNTFTTVREGAVIGGGNTVENEVNAGFVLGGGNTLRNTVSGGAIFGNGNAVQNNVRNDFVVGHSNTFNDVTINSLVLGNKNTLSLLLNNIFAVGDETLITNGVKNVMTMGDNIHVSGGVNAGIAIGDNVQMKGNYSYIAGDGTSAYAPGALVIGPDNLQCCKYEFMLGTELTGWGEHSVMIGKHDVVCNDYSMTLGNDLMANNNYNVLFGDHLKSTNDYQVIIGQYAVGVKDSVLEIGLGTSTIAKTIFRVDRQGNVWMAGDLHCRNVSATSVASGVTAPIMEGPAWTDI